MLVWPGSEIAMRMSQIGASMYDATLFSNQVKTGNEDFK